MKFTLVQIFVNMFLEIGTLKCNNNQIMRKIWMSYKIMRLEYTWMCQWWQVMTLSMSIHFDNTKHCIVSIVRSMLSWCLCTGYHHYTVCLEKIKYAIGVMELVPWGMTIFTLLLCWLQCVFQQLWLTGLVIFLRVWICM